MNRYLFLLLPVLGACSSTPDATATAAEGPVVVAPSTSTGAAVDKQNGLMGHHFGDDLASFQGLTRTPVQPVQPGVMYAAPAVATAFGPAKVLNVRHFFLKGKYYKTTLEAPGDQASIFREEAKRQFGAGQEAGGNQVWWQGERVVATAQTGADQVLTFTIYDKQMQGRAEMPAGGSN